MVIKRYISLNYKFAKAKYLYQYHNLTLFLKCLPILDNRFLYCDLYLIYEDPELIHEIFSQFDETNNKFYEVQISKYSLTHIVFDENTTGKKNLKNKTFRLQFKII